MILIVELLVFCGIIAGIFFFAQPAFAALPPLSDEEREAQTDCIVIGSVTHVSHSEVKTKAGTDIYNIVTVEIETIEKPSPMRELTVGSTIEVYYWQVGERPLGWVGPGGQYTPLRLGEKYRLFLLGGSADNFTLLEPNGCDRID